MLKYSGFEFDDDAPKTAARTEYENMMYLERPDATGNQEKAAKGDTVMATSTRLFQGRVVKDSERKKGESLLASTPVVVLSAILGRTPNLDEYLSAQWRNSADQVCASSEKMSTNAGDLDTCSRTEKDTHAEVTFRHGIEVDVVA